MSKETEKYGDPQERRRLACMGTVDLITHAIKQSEAVSAQQSRIDALERALRLVAALETEKPKPVYDDSMGWDWLTDDIDDIYWGGVAVGKFEASEIARAALHPSDNETGGVGIK